MEAADGSQWAVKRFPSSNLISRDEMFGHSRAFYLTSNRLGLHVVPRTFVGEEDGQPVLFQRRVRGQSSPRIDTEWDNLVAIAILHHVTGITDGHALQTVAFSRGGRSRAAAIDGEMTFGAKGWVTPNEFRQTVRQRALRDPALRVPLRIRESLAKVDLQAWRNELRELAIPQVEIEAAVGRLESVKARGLQAL
ncbi:MAG: hypothetical protein K1X64_19860 [Myxococcaceae bacterium]|nr:hypothetical protein [Myxococcaceae bacterium]